jgi:hypothetical protein
MIILIIYYLEFRNGKIVKKREIGCTIAGTEALLLKYSKWCLDIKISDHVSHHFDFGLCER